MAADPLSRPPIRGCAEEAAGETSEVLGLPAGWQTDGWWRVENDQMYGAPSAGLVHAVVAVLPDGCCAGDLGGQEFVGEGVQPAVDGFSNLPRLSKAFMPIWIAPPPAALEGEAEAETEPAPAPEPENRAPEAEPEAAGAAGPAANYGYKLGGGSSVRGPGLRFGTPAAVATR